MSVSRLFVASNGKEEEVRFVSGAGVDGTMQARKIVISDASFFFRAGAVLRFHVTRIPSPDNGEMYRTRRCIE